MEGIRLERKRWPLVAVVAVCAGLELLIFFGVTSHALAAWLEGRALEGEWGWAAVAGWHLFIPLVGLWVAWLPLVDLRTAYTDEGIVRPRLAGPPVELRWAEVESVYVAALPDRRSHLLRINAPGRSIEINTLYYRRPEELLRLVEDRMRATTGAGAK
jgi:hypothetical protein